MLIQNLLLRPGNNELQASGDLDGQIVHDFEDLARRLRDYQTEHLDKKVKGRSNHYGQWSADNAAKLEYVDRIVEIAKGASMARAPERFTEEEWRALHPQFMYPAALAIALRETSRIRSAYLPETVYVEKQSFHPDDWYLWSVAACRDSDQGRVWDCWTLNLTTGGMNGGHYGLTYEGLKKALVSKKGAHVCQPETCPKGGSDDE